MSFFRQLGAGFTAALVSSLIVFSALSLAAAEGLEGILPAVEAPTQALETPGQATFTPLPSLTPAPPTDCPAPQGWTPYTILNGDTLEGLAAHFHLSVDEISRQNCLLSPSLLPGTVLYLPALPTATQPPLVERDTATLPPPVVPTVERCGPPNGWVRYTVRQGDNLYRLSLAFGVSVAELQFANCLGGSVLITVGEQLWVPFVLPLTPTPQPPTQTPVPPSPIPSLTPSPTMEATPSTTPETPTVTPSETPTASLTPSETPTDTPIP